MQTDFKVRRVEPNPTAAPGRKLLLEAWLMGIALVFLGALLIGVEDPDVYPLIALLAAAVSAEIIAGVICLLKGYSAAGWVALLAWLALPIGITASSAAFNEGYAPAFFGSVVGGGAVLLATAIGLLTAIRRARYGSWWDRQGWDNSP